MTNQMRLVDWLDDLCVRFIVNLPHEELQSVERICFQIEEAQWFYEDFIRPLDPSLPSMNLRIFSRQIFQHCPLFAGFSAEQYENAFEQFMQYKTRVPVRGAIMLNEEMTHAVLVKGWKKGAKWSFPRGKINKDERDLDCAIREVYEETGFDLRAAGLIGPEEEMKGLAVNMHQQNLLLFPVRGVPMDTIFIPRTRKEISKVDWYKLGDLPTLKHKNRVQQGTGQDLLKENNFYMVGPFIGQLKGWIKHQKRLDRLHAPTNSLAPPSMATGVTDTELEGDLGETTADEGLMLDHGNGPETFADLVANLGRPHRASETLPEVSVDATLGNAVDPAEELKRLLSVGTGLQSYPQPDTFGAQQQDPQPNPLLAMLHSNNRALAASNPNPRTPFDQILSNPQLPHSPHGQHHPRPPQLDHMPPPPPFGSQLPASRPFEGQFNQVHHAQAHNGYSMAIPPQFLPPPPHQSHPMFSPGAVPQNYSQQPPPPYSQTIPYQPSQLPQFPEAHGPLVPPASKLPAPKLTTHTLGLLNAFKMNEKPATTSPQEKLQPSHSLKAAPLSFDQHQSSRQNAPFASHTMHSTRAVEPSSPAFHSAPVPDSFQPVQPKPRNAHQDSLLSLFRSPSVAAATPSPQMLDPPAELSAHPTTPGASRIQPVLQSHPPLPDLNTKPAFVDAFATRTNQPGTTSATVRGPVNAPDFDTVKKNSQHTLNGDSRGPSPARQKEEQKTFVPQQILKREDTLEMLRGTSIGSAQAATNKAPTAKAPSAAFKPQILKRPQQSASPAPPSIAKPAGAQTAHTQGLLNLFKSPSPMQASPTSTGPLLPTLTKSMSSQPVDQSRRPSSSQKTALLSLFGKPAQAGAAPAPSSSSPFASAQPSPSIKGSFPPNSRSPQPPTPKTVTSSVISPVSPLPRDSSLTGSPAQPLVSRSRISSIGEAVNPSSAGTTASSKIQQAPTSHPVQNDGLSVATKMPVAEASNGLGRLNLGGVDNGKGKAATGSPVDKTFLLGFLNDFAKQGR